MTTTDLLNRAAAAHDRWLAHPTDANWAAFLAAKAAYDARVGR